MNIIDYVQMKYGEKNIPQDVDIQKEWDNYMLEQFENFLYNGSSLKYLEDPIPVVKKKVKAIEDISQELKGEGKVYFITFTTEKEDAAPIDTVQNMAKAAINSKLFKITKYCYCIEKGDDNDNWHVHMLCRCVGIKNGKKELLPYDKIKKLKTFKYKRVDFKVVGPTEKDLNDTLKYVCKNANKYQEVNDKFESNIFSNFELPFKDMIYNKNTYVL